MYVYIYVYVHVYIYICMYICMYMYMYIYIYASVRIINIHSFTYIYKYIILVRSMREVKEAHPRLPWIALLNSESAAGCICIYIYVYIHIYISFIYIYMYTHVYINIYTYIYIHIGAFFYSDRKHGRNQEPHRRLSRVALLDGESHSRHRRLFGQHATHQVFRLGDALLWKRPYDVSGGLFVPHIHSSWLIYIVRDSHTHFLDWEMLYFKNAPMLCQVCVRERLSCSLFDMYCDSHTYFEKKKHFTSKTPVWRIRWRVCDAYSSSKSHLPTSWLAYILWRLGDL